jgi:hypothetical protein
VCEAIPPGISLAESRTQRLIISVHIATQNETAPVHCSHRGATSNLDHQLVIGDRDDIRLGTILTIVAQGTAAIREEKF